MKSQGIFVATPTHICKRYCAQEFWKSAVEHIVKPFGAKFHIYCNSRASAKIFYDSPHITYKDMRLGEDCFENKAAIHRRLLSTVKALREDFLLTDLEWYLSLESDVIIGPGMMKAMLDRDVDVLHTNCYPHFQPMTSFGPVDRITMGCTLVKRYVIDSVEFSCDENILEAHYDAFFVNHCREKGFGVFYDPLIEPQHREDSLPGRGWSQIPWSER